MFLFKVVIRARNCYYVKGKILANLDYNARLSFENTLNNNSSINLNNKIDITGFRNNMLYILDTSSLEQSIEIQNKNLIFIMTIYFLDYSYNKKTNLF